MINTHNRKNRQHNLFYLYKFIHFQYTDPVYENKAAWKDNKQKHVLKKLYFVCQAFTTVVSINMCATT